MGMKMLIWLLVFCLSAPRMTWADDSLIRRLSLMSSEAGISQIPQQPSQPPGLIQKKVINYSHCERYFLLDGKRYECDSNLGRDAERLRSIVQDVPLALAELDTYQKNLRDVRVSGYLVTSALVLVVLGLIFSQAQPFNPANGGLTPGGGFILGGLTLGIGSIIHGVSTIHVNEQHIDRAVHYYNAVHPERPVELQFDTGTGSR